MYKKYFNYSRIHFIRGKVIAKERLGDGMSQKISLDQLENELKFFYKIYDVVRLVDPLKKRVIEYNGDSFQYTNHICYDYWKKGKICDNCISVRANIENTSFVKIEEKENKILMVTAIPIENDGNPVVLELLKDATSSMFIGNGDYNKGEPLVTAINRMNDLIVKDTLTNLYNRRFVNDRLPVDILHAKLNHQPLSVCFIDLDHFKELNDTFGHDIGDQAIKAVSDIFRNYTRAGLDWVARIGGDEFIICFKNKAEDEVTILMEQIRSDVEKIPATFGSNNIHFSISYGIKTLIDSLMTAEELIHMADEKMYEYKKSK